MRKIVLLAALAAAIPAFGQIDASRTVVVVNGDEVKGAEYYHRMEYLPNVGKKVGTGLVEFPPGFLAIEQLITERLVDQLARQKGVYPSDIEVQAELKARLDADPKLLDNWKLTGQSEDDFMRQLRFEMAMFKLNTFGVIITDQQVQQRYDSSPNTYTIPKQVKLKVIVVDDAAKKKSVDQALAAGTDFSEVAKAQSVDVTKSVGGDFGTVPVTMLAPEIRASVDQVKPGQVTPWVGGENAGVARYARFMVVESIPAKRMPLDANLKRNIRRQMQIEQGSVKNDVDKEMREMRRTAKVDIKQPEFAKLYDAYVKAYLQEGK